MTHDDVVSSRLIIRLLPLAALEATAAERMDEVARLLDLDLPQDWKVVVPLARLRLEQLVGDPGYLPWSIRAIALAQTREAAGYVNFHDAPARHDMAKADHCVEFGYTIFPGHRRRGYAEEAVRAMMPWAQARGAENFIFSVAPENEPSLSLISKLGARKIGVQIDEEDGPEDVHLLNPRGR